MDHLRLAPFLSLSLILPHHRLTLTIKMWQRHWGEGHEACHRTQHSVLIHWRLSPSTLSEAETVVYEQLTEVYIDQGDKRQWRTTLMEKS